MRLVLQPRAGGFLGNVVPLLGGALPCLRFSLLRERGGRGSLVTFPLQGMLDGSRSFRVRLVTGATLAGTIGALGTAPRPFGGLAFGRRRQFHAGAAGLGKSNGHCLLRRARPVLARANVLHLLLDEFPRLHGLL